MDIPYIKIESNKNTYALVKTEVIHKNLNISNLAQKISSKSYGIGCDGLIILDDHYKPIPSIRCFNFTGSEVPLSINSLIVTGYYLFNTTFKQKDVIKVKLNGCVYELSNNEETISVNLNILNYYSFEKMRIGRTIINGFLIHFGYNHYYILNKGDLSIQFFKQHLGKKISKKYQASVGLINLYHKNNVRIITYDRGVGLKSSSGSNICAALYILNKENLIDDVVNVDTFHNTLQCEVNQNKIIYQATANLIAKGVFYL